MTIPCKEIQDYIDLVRSGTVEVCEEQRLLCDHVESCFQRENLIVDQKQLSNYLGLQKYFPFSLFEWEAFCFALHNCVYSRPGVPRWPDLLVLVGRGAGKNGYLSFEDLCLISEYNGIRNYDIDICANSEDQAKTSFDEVWEVLEANQAKMRSHFSWTKEVIRSKKTGSKLRFRTSNHKTKDGGKQGKIDFDEYHEYEDYRTITVFKTGLGKKPQPRTTVITTNGNVRGGPLDQLIATANQILRGKIADNGLLPFICKLDKEEEVDDPSKWDKANPSLRFLPVLRQQIEKEYIDYRNDPVGNSDFLTKRMNIPRGNRDVEVTSWENILATNREVPDLAGQTCVVGIDYMKTTDFLAAGLLFLFGGVYYWLTHSWVCSSCDDLERIKAPLEAWEKAGLLTFVDGPEIPPSVPAAWLQEMAGTYNLTVLGIDGYRYTLLAKALREAGFDTDKKSGANPIKLIRPSDQMMTSPTIASAFATKTIVWGDSPLMRWYTNNACQVTSEKGNVTYGKIEPKSRKTDGFMAFVAAMCVAGGLEDGAETPDLFSLKTYTY